MALPVAETLEDPLSLGETLISKSNPNLLTPKDQNGIYPNAL